MSTDVVYPVHPTTPECVDGKPCDRCSLIIARVELAAVESERDWLRTELNRWMSRSANDAGEMQRQMYNLQKRHLAALRRAKPRSARRKP